MPTERAAAPGISLSGCEADETPMHTHGEGPSMSSASKYSRCALGNRVPADVDLRYHFCYGDKGIGIRSSRPIWRYDGHGRCAWRRLKRPIDHIHMPVPRDRSDDAYSRR